MWAGSRRETVSTLLSNRAFESTRALFTTSSNASELFPNALIHPSAKIGKGCRIGPFSTVGEGVVIGDDTIISANVTLQNCSIGSKVVIHPGARIGQDGFGYVLDAHGEHVKKPQELSVEIHDHVEIGANCTIDRGSWRNTVIGKGCKLDNLVRIDYFCLVKRGFPNGALSSCDQIQIGHNVQLGANCIIAGQTGIAGSTTLGKNVHIGGQVGVTQHLSIGDNVRIAAKSGVMNHLDSNATYGGTPAVPIMEYRRLMAHLRRLGKKFND